MSGPLVGTRVLELSAIGPAPFGVMLLADLGAEVTRVDRVTSAKGQAGLDATQRGVSRGRRSIAVDLKDPEGVEVFLRLVDEADVLVEGWRPGVAERLGVGPDVCCERNAGLVYARMTGWGQTGPLAARAGHDINYAAVAGALYPIGDPDRPPPPPLNFIADYGGGGTYLAIGVLGALLDRERSGQGQVVDVAMVDGASSLAANFHYLLADEDWEQARGANLIDGSRPYYRCYATSDDEFMAVGALEPQFYAALLDTLGLDAGEWPQEDRSRWPALHERLESIFGSKTRDEWTAAFDGVDACVTPVLSLAEAPTHTHNVTRSSFVELGGWPQPAPAPRFSRTRLEVGEAPPDFGAHTDDILHELGCTEEEVRRLRGRGTVA